MAALRSGDPAAVGPLLSNDLQPAALSLQPRCGARSRRARARRARRDRLRLRADLRVPGRRAPTAARDLAVALTGAGVCRAVVQVTGPVPGAATVRPRSGTGDRAAGVNLVNLEAGGQGLRRRGCCSTACRSACRPGDRIGVVGRNGAGKTTLLGRAGRRGRPRAPGASTRAPRRSASATCRRPSS